MKIVTLALAATMMIGSIAQAQWDGGYGSTYPRNGGYSHYDRYGRDCGYYGCGDAWDRGQRRGGNGDGTVVIGASCAPEVLEGNVAATDRTLATLAASSQFASATTFKATVKRIAAVRSPDQRAAQYFKLIGVDASNKDQVVEFIGARDVKSSQVAELERATGLSSAQADKVASSLQTALRGQLH